MLRKFIGLCIEHNITSATVVYGILDAKCNWCSADTAVFALGFFGEAWIAMRSAFCIQDIDIW